MSDQPASPFPSNADPLAALVEAARPTPFRVTVSVELVEGTGWSIVSTEAIDRSAFLALHTAAAAIEESLHVHPHTRDGSSRVAGRHGGLGVTR